MDRTSRKLELPGLVVTAERPEPAERTDPVAVAALVCGVVALVPVAVVLGVLALVRTRRPGVGGRRLAVTGLALSALWTVGFVVILGGALLVGSRVVESVGDLGQAGPAGPTSLQDDGETTAASQVQAGQCLDAWDPAAASGDIDPDVVVVRCTTPHGAQAFGRVDLSEEFPDDATYPGTGALATSAVAACTGRLDGAVDPDRGAGLDVSAVLPTSASWAAGARAVTCLVVAPGRTLTTSVTL